MSVCCCQPALPGTPSVAAVTLLRSPAVITSPRPQPPCQCDSLCDGLDDGGFVSEDCCSDSYCLCSEINGNPTYNCSAGTGFCPNQEKCVEDCSESGCCLPTSTTPGTTETTTGTTQSSSTNTTTTTSSTSTRLVSISS